jgi:hypothetical protein
MAGEDSELPPQPAIKATTAKIESMRIAITRHYSPGRAGDHIALCRIDRKAVVVRAEVDVSERELGVASVARHKLVDMLGRG